MAADVIVVTNRTGTIVPLAQGVVLPIGGRHVYQQNDLTNAPYVAEHLARAVQARLIDAITYEGETLTPGRLRAIGRAIHAHTHDPIVGIDPLTGSSGGAALVPASCLPTDVPGDAVRISGPGATPGAVYAVTRVDVTSGATMPAVGLLRAKTTATSCIVQLSGPMPGVLSGLTSGKTYFVGPAGTPTTAPPAPGGPGTRAYVQVIGVALDATTMMVAPDGSLFIRSGG